MSPSTAGGTPPRPWATGSRDRDWPEQLPEVAETAFGRSGGTDPPPLMRQVTYTGAPEVNTLTKAEAMTADTFHLSESCHATVHVGPRGGITVGRTEVYRRNGRTQTWKTRPNDYSIPVKYGLRQAFRITDFNASDFHVGSPEDCPKGTLRDALAAATNRT